ncbi:MAG: hypothetical protein GY871_13840, partial [Actinomycetales bacterium]|nr:hypothetical protein [Actinomycetales bacterium]
MDATLDDKIIITSGRGRGVDMVFSPSGFSKEEVRRVEKLDLKDKKGRIYVAPGRRHNVKAYADILTESQDP